MQPTAEPSYEPNTEAPCVPTAEPSYGPTSKAIIPRLDDLSHPTVKFTRRPSFKPTITP